MKVSVEEPHSYQKVLTIEIPAESIDSEIENIYSKIKETATHPGFRKGKVPRKILEKKFSKSIRMEAIESIANESLKKALEEQAIVPLTEPEIGDIDFESTGPVSFKVTVEVEPAIELADYKEIELKRPKATVTDEDVEKTIERLRISHAKYIPAERPVERGDFLVIDFAASHEGKPIDRGRAENFPLEVGSGAFGEDFENQILGMNKDEEKNVTVKYADDYRAEDFAGKEISFEVRVKDVKLRQLPELDDDFAKDLGEYTTLEELKKHVRESLEKDLEKRIDRFVREQAIMKITSASTLEVPPKLKLKVASSIFEEEVRRLAYRGVEQETLLQEREKIESSAEVEAERQLKIKFVTDEICRRENLSVTDEELNETLDEMIRESEDKDARVKDYFKSERVRARYRDQLLAGKVLDFVVGNAKIEEVDTVDTTEAELESGQSPDDEKGEN